jgi:hypothetical protein
MNMKTTRKNHGPFVSVKRTITGIALKQGKATLSCDIQKGTLPLGSTYCTRPQWYIKFEGSPCAMGPWTAEAIRKYFTA